jgi:NAD(P)-dependent dehydrogenase (short-subunit alcohol dehydrogenase family)
MFVNNLLKDHVAFVTGGGTGITGGVARALAEAWGECSACQSQVRTPRTCGPGNQ